jgi:[ribosomal protein S18]-alanine N-acetyltransferase
VTVAVETRLAQPADIEAIGRIQAACETAAQWPPADYLSYECRVAELQGEVAGFVVWSDAGGEGEIINLAVAPRFRNRGVARKLIEDVFAGGLSELYLEVRESNAGARAFYRKNGFSELGKRPGYYDFPAEDAVVMKWQSC